MNNKLKLLVNVLPVIIVPLIAERKNIKQHPDIEKLNHVSKSAYTTVKDKSTDTAAVIKDKGISAYETGRYTYDAVSDKISETRQNRQHKKAVKDRLNRMKEHAESREEPTENTPFEITEIPKMMQSTSHSPSNEEKMRGMLVSEDVRHSLPLLLEQGQREVNSHHPVIYDYDKEEWFTNDSHDEEHLALTTKGINDKLRLDYTDELKENTMTHINVQEEFFSRVRNHEENIEAFNNSHLFLKHRQSLAPNLKFENENTILEHSALFQKHREQAEQHIEKIGRRSSVDSNMKRSKSQKKFEDRLKRVQ